jgi:hypothetical protein
VDERLHASCRLPCQLPSASAGRLRTWRRSMAVESCDTVAFSSVEPYLLERSCITAADMSYRPPRGSRPRSAAKQERERERERALERALAASSPGGGAASDWLVIAGWVRSAVTHRWYCTMEARAAASQMASILV